MKLDDAAAHLEALAIRPAEDLSRLVRAGDAGMSVGRLQDKLKIAPSTLSHPHQDADGGRADQSGADATTLVCHANYDVMRGLVEFLVAECCTGADESKDAKSAA